MSQRHAFPFRLDAIAEVPFEAIDPFQIISEQRVRTSEDHDERTVIDDAYLSLFSSPQGRIVLRDMVDRYLSEPTWRAGMDASFGHAREGQNSVVRDIYNRMKAAMTRQEERSHGPSKD